MKETYLCFLLIAAVVFTSVSAGVVEWDDEDAEVDRVRRQTSESDTFKCARRNMERARRCCVLPEILSLRDDKPCKPAEDATAVSATPVVPGENVKRCIECALNASTLVFKETGELDLNTLKEKYIAAGFTANLYDESVNTCNDVLKKLNEINQVTTSKKRTFCNSKSVKMYQCIRNKLTQICPESKQKSALKDGTPCTNVLKDVATCNPLERLNILEGKAPKRHKTLRKHSRTRTTTKSPTSST